MLDSEVLKNYYAFFALLEVVSERAFLVLDEVAFYKQSACVKLVKVGRKEKYQNQKYVEDHPKQCISLAEVFVL